MSTLKYELKIIFKTTIVVIIILLLFLTFGGKAHKYYDYNHARYEGLFERGWVPEYIPESSKRIEIVNGASYSAACVRFYIPASHSDDFVRILNQKGYKQVNDSYEEPPYFGLLYNRCAFDVDDVKNSSLEIYNLKTETLSTGNYVIGRHDTYFALDKYSGVVYYWLVPRSSSSDNL